MKILESVPSRYDRGINILTRGKLNGIYNRLTAHIERGHRVLDLGCGTGALTLRAARKGALVKGIDVNSQMLEIAQMRTAEANLQRQVTLCEMGVAELGNESSQSYDVVMSGLCLSELTEDELKYVLKEAARILKPDGILLVADEVVPKPFFKRVLNGLVRLPLVTITYFLTQTTTKAVSNLVKKITDAGFQINAVRLNKMESFAELVASKPGEKR